MKERNLLNAMSGIDYRYIADAAPSGHKHKRRNFAMAASVCLILAGVLLFLTIPASVPGTVPTSITGTVPIINGASTTLSYSPLFSSAGSSSDSPSPPRSDFELPGTHVVVEGRILDISPDVYMDLPSYTPYGYAARRLGEYYLLKVQVIDVVIGEGVPQEFYFQIPADCAHPELLEYDSFIFSLYQIGMEDHVFLNTRTNTYETFSMVFEIRSDLVMRGGLLAFTDGKLDLSLWTEVWGRSYSSISKYLSDESNFPIKSRHTAEQAKQAIRTYYDTYRTDVKFHAVMSKSDFEGEQAKAALEYIQPFTNGVFSFGLGYAMRIINGYRTTEVLRVYSDRVEYIGEPFTKQDLMNLPDISKILEQIDFSALAPPHTPHYKELEQTSCGTDAWYTKVNGKVYGVVKVYWDFRVPDDVTKTYYDDMYIIAYPDGSYSEIDREKLRALIVTEDGLNKGQISTLPYNTVIERDYNQP